MDSTNYIVNWIMMKTIDHKKQIQRAIKNKINITERFNYLFLKICCLIDYNFYDWKLLQSLYYETGQTVLFWDILWQENFVCMNCETYLALEYAHKPTWPTGFEKSKIHQPSLEKLQFKGSRIEAFLLDFEGKCWKLTKNASILLP